MGGTRKTILATTAVSSEGAIVAEVKQAKAKESGVRSQESVGEAAAATAAPEPDIPLPTSLSLTPEQLQTAIKTAVDAAVGEATAALRGQVETLRATNTQLTQEKTGLEQVFKVLGKVAPQVNTHLSSGRDRVEGLARDFIQACESAPAGVWVNPNTGRVYAQRDMLDAKRLFWSEQSQLRADMEVYARDHGLLRGRGIEANQAATVRADIPPALLDYLSMVMRETHRGRYVYWQFPFYKLELGKGPRDTIQVARLRWIPGATAVSDRILTSAPLTGNRQPVVINPVSLTLQECGLGSGNPNNSQPVAVPEFLIAYSMISLEAAVTKVLGNDYESWEDLAIRSRYLATTRVVYSDNGRVVTSPSAFTAQTDATVTEMFLNNLYAYMSGLQIPPLDDVLRLRHA